MKTQRKIAAIAGIVTFGIAGAAAATVYATHTSTSGDYAQVELFGYNDCGFTDAFISGVNVSQQQSGTQPTGYTQVFIDFESVNYCTNQFLSGDGATNAGGFQGHSTSNANFNITFPVDLFTNYCPGGEGEGEGSVGEGEGSVGEGEGSIGEGEGEGQAFLANICYPNITPTNLTMNLLLSGTGETSRGMYSQSYTGGGGTVHQRFNGSSRQATVSGSVVINGVDLLAQSQYIYGTIGTQTQGTLDVVHY